ncbi:hypothetical protein EDB81DRAFT_399461 [Dactylonectria macrodidyma]|uniref:Uncharacterized protein n=1 Tax=Dactylonectria macrodidyma TaxID=307937 RepID=A0A9P9FA46_9HYPO|nr:hypothetical protein EDB81DRAFT_399461 [Dactylonectria macrodidyma]
MHHVAVLLISAGATSKGKCIGFREVLDLLMRHRQSRGQRGSAVHLSTCLILYACTTGEPGRAFGRDVLVAEWHVWIPSVVWFSAISPGFVQFITNVKAAGEASKRLIRALPRCGLSARCFILCCIYLLRLCTSLYNCFSLSLSHLISSSVPQTSIPFLRGLL